MARPLKFNSPEEIKNKANEYFNDTPYDLWTISGLANSLDTSRETLCNYEDRDEFFDTIKAIKGKVEESYETSLRKRGNSGDIFGLKNFGWKDKSEVDANVSGGLKLERFIMDE